MPGIASSATAIVIAHVAAGTSRIRVGAGGIMLPNHSPLVVAEQFGTLESLFPGRIDLGLGRAPGTDRETMLALRRDAVGAENDFPAHVQELRACSVRRRRVSAFTRFLAKAWPCRSGCWDQRIQRAARGRPGAAICFRVTLRARLLTAGFGGLSARVHAIGIADRPYAMAAINVVAADDERDAHRWFTSVQQQFINLRRGAPTPLPPPVDSMEGRWTDSERAMVHHTLRYAVVGAPDTVRTGLRAFLQLADVDELQVTAHIFDQAARLRSFEIVADVLQ